MDDNSIARTTGNHLYKTTEAAAFCTVQELANLLRVSPKTVYHWVLRNEIPFLRCGKHLRFNCKRVIERFQADSPPLMSACDLSPTKGIRTQAIRSKDLGSLTTSPAVRLARKEG